MMVSQVGPSPVKFRLPGEYPRVHDQNFTGSVRMIAWKGLRGNRLKYFPTSNYPQAWPSQENTYTLVGRWAESAGGEICCRRLGTKVDPIEQFGDSNSFTGRCFFFFWYFVFGNTGKKIMARRSLPPINTCVILLSYTRDVYMSAS